MNKKVLAFAGSTSSTSINKELATYVVTNLNEIDYEVLDMNDYNAPVYSIDEEKNGFPKEIESLNEKFQSVDGFIVSLAEHNGSYAAAFKNIIDWMSRLERNIFNDKPLLLMSASPGGRGGAGVLAAAKAYFPHAGAKEIIDFSFPKFYENFKESEIVNSELKKTLLEKLKDFELVM